MPSINDTLANLFSHSFNGTNIQHEVDHKKAAELFSQDCAQCGEPPSTRLNQDKTKMRLSNRPAQAEEAILTNGISWSMLQHEKNPTAVVNKFEALCLRCATAYGMDGGWGFFVPVDLKNTFTNEIKALVSTQTGIIGIKNFEFKADSNNGSAKVTDDVALVRGDLAQHFLAAGILGEQFGDDIKTGEQKPKPDEIVHTGNK